MASSDSLPITSMIHMVTIKLSSSNYLLWKRQVMPMLTCFDLLPHVDGTAPPAEFVTDASGASSPNPAYLAWNKLDQKLLGVLFSTLTEESMAEVVECTSSRAAWLALESAFSHSSVSRVHQLREELLSLRRGSLTVKEYGSKFKTLCDQLSAIGRPVDDADKSHWFLRGLGASFASFADTRMSMSPVPPFSTLLHQAVQFELMTAAMEPSPAPSVAFMASHRSSGSWKPSSRSPGHTGGRGSPTAGRGNRGSSGGRGSLRKPRCQICRGEHYANKCPQFLGRHPDPHANLAEAFHASCNVSAPASDWYVDSGASAHMTADASGLSQVQPYDGPGNVVVGNGTRLHISHTGSASLHNNVNLLDVLVVPHITKNLLSISKLTNDYPVDVLFSDRSFIIQNRVTKQPVAQGRCERGLYVLDRGTPALLAAVTSQRSTASFDLWHLRLGHVPFSVISMLNKQGHLSVTSLLPSPHLCSSCQLAKSKRLSFPLNDKIATSVLDLVHCDLWGPAPITSMHGYRYYVIFVDDFSRFTWLYPLRAKSEFYDVFVKFCNLVCTQFSTSIKQFQSDGGSEFVNNRVRAFLDSKGIQHRISCPYTPQQNGRAERKHRHIVEVGLSMLFHAQAPATFWLDAFTSAVYIINRLPTPILQDKSPFEALFGNAPYYPAFKPFGCRVFPYLRDYSPHKLAPRSAPCIFLGYSSLHKGFRCFDPSTSRTYVTRHAQFDELLFPFAAVPARPTPRQPLELSSFLDCASSAAPSSPPPMGPSTSPSSSSASPCAPCADDSATSQPVVTPAPPTPPRLPQSLPTPDLATRAPHPPANSGAAPSSSTHPMITRSKAGVFKPRYPVDLALASPLVSALAASVEPRGYKSAARHPHWQAAMQEEMDALHHNKTWDLVPPPPDTNIVGSKWVFRIKYRTDGSIDRYKARLVAQGFTQVPGADFHHTFSPVVRAATVRAVLALSVSFGWSLHQLDVKNAFLNGVLTQPVYMAQPPGFVDESRPNYVCRLRKALYGLRQAPLAWYQRFSSFLFTLGFRQSRCDTSLFTLHHGASCIYLLLYVDDIIVTGNNPSFIRSFISAASKEFALKDLGALNYFLGLEISSQPHGLFIGQAKYAHDILERARMLECKPVSTPLATGAVLTRSGSSFRDPTLYRSLVGALQYLTISRPDLSYAVNQVSQFLQSPTDLHFEAVKRILRYVKGTLHFGLSFTNRMPLSIVAYSDADWARCIDTRRSTYGYSIFLGGNLVSWSAKKQPTVSRSSCESEYRALANAASEVVWLSHLLRELRVPLSTPPVLFCDNSSALFLSQNPVAHKRAKHIDIDCHFVRDLVTAGKLQTKFVPSHRQLADIFTKSLPRPTFELLRSKLCVSLHPTPRLKGGNSVISGT